MGSVIEGVCLEPLSIIEVENGNILHGLKSSDKEFESFGEAYFSIIEFEKIKAWKKHIEMTLNIIVPVGEIKFVLFDDRSNSLTYRNFQVVNLSTSQYSRLTIPKNIWLGFQGVGKKLNLLLNIASIEHDPNEVIKKDINQIEYNWEPV